MKKSKVSRNKKTAKKTYVDNKGYRRFSDSDIPVHRHVAEKKLGRPLQDGEVVHHKNRDKQDNSPSNLYVFKNQDEHWAAHKKDAQKHGWDYSLKGKE